MHVHSHGLRAEIVSLENQNKYGDATGKVKS